MPIPTDSEGFSEETREAVRHIIETRGASPPPSSYLTYAGKAGALLSDLIENLRFHSTLSDAETELAICVAARAADCDYIWNAHTRGALRAGAREEALQAVDTYAAPDGLTADEALIIQFGRELLEGHRVSDETFEKVRARYGERGMMEMQAVMSVYIMNSNILNLVDYQAAADARHLAPRKG